MKIFSISFLLSIILLSSCATVFKGTGDLVNFTSSPGGAKVYINGFYKGTTPLRLKLETNKTYNIEFKKGGKTKTYTITNTIGAGWIILDIFGGLIPVIIDAATGAWYSLDQNSIHAAFEEE